MNSRVPALWILLLLATPAAAEPWSEGQQVEAFSLEDQHGETHRVGPDTRFLLFTRDMDGGDVLEEALADQTGEGLAAKQAFLVADISGMPRLIARLFAVPSMRKRAYPMLLDRDGETTRRLPSQKGEATVLRLESLRLESVTHTSDAARVRALLGLSPAEDGEPE